MKAAILAATGAALISPLVAPVVHASASGTTWGSLADKAIIQAQAADTGVTDPFPYSFTALAIVNRHGWTPTATTYLGKVMAAQRKTGGWNLPSHTETSTVTTAAHVGPLLIAAYKAHKITAAPVKRALDFLYSLPTTGKARKCIAPNDAGTGPACINNISALAAQFMHETWQAGIHYRTTDYNAHVVPMVSYDAAQYNGKGFWPYATGATALNDWDHNASNVQVQLHFGRPEGKAALKWMTGHTPPPGEENAPLAKVHLARYSCPTWAPAEMNAYYAAIPSNPRPMWRYAEIAYWGSLDAKTC